MLLAGAARRSRVRRVVLLAHTFGYAVLLGVVAWAVDAGVLRGFLVGVSALMLWHVIGLSAIPSTRVVSCSGGGGTYYVLTGVSRL